jgi:hypothetical protein
MRIDDERPHPSTPKLIRVHLPINPLGAAHVNKNYSVITDISRILAWFYGVVLLCLFAHTAMSGFATCNYLYDNCLSSDYGDRALCLGYIEGVADLMTDEDTLRFKAPIRGQCKPSSRCDHAVSDRTPRASPSTCCLSCRGSPPRGFPVWALTRSGAELFPDHVRIDQNI